MAGMYEKLGDLLNETLEAGHVKFIHIEKEDPPTEAESKGTEDAASEAQGAEQKADGREGGSSTKEDFARSFYDAEREAEKRYFKTSRSEKERNAEGNRSGRRRVIYRRISPELEKAYALFGLSISASKDDVKKAYKEKLLYYHPDRYAGKELMEKIANDKTRELVAAYKLLMEFLR